MALTPFQRDVCRTLADTRRRLDLFHDTDEALAASWQADRVSLADEGFAVTIVRERPTYVEAEVRRGPDVVVVEWARDSAYRFFPLVEHPDLGLVLHPFDLATNKVLALVGRLEPRDFIDVLTCDRRLQPLGYLAWAACGKDPGFSPGAILGQAARGARYTQAELASLDFESGPPDAATISREWHDALTAAHGAVAALPAGEVGRAVLDRQGRLFRGTEVDLRRALDSGGLVFHPGCIRGALPRLLR